MCFLQDKLANYSIFLTFLFLTKAILFKVKECANRRTPYCRSAILPLVPALPRTQGISQKIYIEF